MLYSLFATPCEFADGRRPKTSYHLFLGIRRGERLARKPEIPEYYWDLIAACWATDPLMRPTFWELVERMRTDHGYILPESDRAVVLRYEEKVYRRFGPPRTRT
jgi:hypothetical protein